MWFRSRALSVGFAFVSFAALGTVGGCHGRDNPAGGKCGDGIVQAGEACDDGNTVDGDGCESNCMPTGGMDMGGDDGGPPVKTCKSVPPIASGTC